MRLNIFGGIRPFKPRGAGRDALAGVTLASMSIRRLLSFSTIAFDHIGRRAGLVPLRACRSGRPLCALRHWRSDGEPEAHEEREYFFL